jgi:hypothetical protein
MRSRDRILTNLETIYRESYDRAKREQLTLRMEELDAAYQRDQLMMEVLLDIRDLFAQPSAGGTGTGALQTLDALRKLAKR